MLISINGQMLKKMYICGANELLKNKQRLDALNVFPVPDGDTGTNMCHTAQHAVSGLDKLATESIVEIAKAVSSGSLRGARGNSGVILSQIMRGFARGFEEMIDDKYSLISAKILAHSFTKASETAFKAMMKPKEGTILTLARAVGERAEELADETDDIEGMLSDLLVYGRTVLEKTKQMLPELRNANVVDAGAMGYLLIIEGFYTAVSTGDKDYTLLSAADASISENAVLSAYQAGEVDIKFCYCTEFFINKGKRAWSEDNESILKNKLSDIGDSIVVVSDEDIIKVHVHSNNPGACLEIALKTGELSNIKIDNMRIQHSSIIEANGSVPSDEQFHTVKPAKKEYGIVTVTMGEGFKQLFTELGADVIVEGGQTMNPSAQDIINAIDEANAKTVYVLPNNKNIILAAKQASAIYGGLPNEQVSDTSDHLSGETSDGTVVYVVESESMPQGVTALVSFSAELGADDNYELMMNSSANVKTGQVTSAVRATIIDGMDINEGDYICMLDGKISCVSKECLAGAKELAGLMIENGDEIVTVYYGENASEEDADELADHIRSMYPDSEVAVYNGGQPVYNFVLSSEM